MKNKAALFWSGGKDSAYALHLIKNNHPEIEISLLITTLNEEYKRISMHGIREELLDKQAQSLRIPLYKMWVPNIPTNENYENCLHATLDYLKAEDFEYVVYGDIFLEDLRKYREMFLAKKKLKGLFPLWEKNTTEQLKGFISEGFKTITCCVNSKYLTEEWVGQVIDEHFLNILSTDVDPCGENGEFHTFCFDGPIFSAPVEFTIGQKEYKPLSVKTTETEKEFGFWYVDLY